MAETTLQDEMQALRHIGDMRRHVYCVSSQPIAIQRVRIKRRIRAAGLKVDPKASTRELAELLKSAPKGTRR